MHWKEEAKKQFAKRLMELLEEQDQGSGPLSLRQLALRSNLEYSQVQRISKGQVDLAMTTIIALANGLGVPPKALMDF